MVFRRRLGGARPATLVPVLLLVGSAPVLAQGGGGEIRGAVRSVTGARVVIALVTIQNQETDWIAQAPVDARGEFVFRPAPSGAYRIEVLSPQFKRYLKEDIVVEPRRPATVMAKLEPGSVDDTLTSLGGGHLILGYAWNDFGYGTWSHAYAVASGPDGRAFGRVKVSVLEPETPEKPEFSLDYLNDIDCLELDPDTGSAWLGGRLTETSNPGLFPLGLYVVDFARDGGAGNAGDFHGDHVPAMAGVAETCHTRLGPIRMDPAEKGNIVVR